jgi:hypothetical protein
MGGREDEGIRRKVEDGGSGMENINNRGLNKPSGAERAARKMEGKNVSG